MFLPEDIFAQQPGNLGSLGKPRDADDGCTTRKPDWLLPLEESPRIQRLGRQILQFISGPKL
jgi:hypothetical protein